MFDIKSYGYTGPETIDGDLFPGRVTELRRELYKVICRYGEVSAVLKGTFFNNALTRGITRPSAILC